MKMFLLLRQVSNMYPYREVQMGIIAAGHEVIYGTPTPDDDLKQCGIVTWNDYGKPATIAKRVRDAGGLHISLENGYTNAYRAERVIALSKNKHHFIDHEFVRRVLGYRNVDISFIPSRKKLTRNSEFIGVFGQRGGQYSDMAMPNRWPDDVITMLRAKTNTPILFKPHPFKYTVPILPHNNVTILPVEYPMSCLLPRLKQAVVFTSNASTETIIYGIPTSYRGPRIPLLHCAQQDHLVDYLPSDDLLQNQLRYMVASEFTYTELAGKVLWGAICADHLATIR